MIKQILGLVVLFALSGGAAYAGNPGDQTTSSVFDFTGAGQPGNTTLVRTPNGRSARWASHGVGVALDMRTPSGSSSSTNQKTASPLMAWAA